MKLIEILPREANDLFERGYTVYIQYADIDVLPETCNTFMLNADKFDANMNIYKRGYNTPKEYGYKNIVSWITENINNIPKFFTFYHKEVLIIDSMQNV